MPSTNWQTKLDDACEKASLQKPVFELVSDRRGTRTAWSSSVYVFDRQFQAMFWYDGKHLNGAREDAAEVAYKWFEKTNPTVAAEN